MGAADVVPGVSGGTMAFITGIYEELILSIKSVDLTAFRLVVSLRWKEALAHIRWPFLVAVLAGILGAIFSLAKGIAWLLEHTPVHLWAFFFGLVLASVLTVSKRVGRWGVGMLSVAGLAAVGAYLLVGLVPVETPEAGWFVLLSGMIAVCAMILPGISGSFILVLLGKYQYILAAVNNRDVVTLGIFAVGAAIGLLSFAQVLGWIFRRHHDLTVAMLTGLMVGSLRKIWPWKETISTMLNRHGKTVPVERVNILPETFSGEVGLAAALAALGIVLVVLLDRVAAHRGDARGEKS